MRRDFGASSGDTDQPVDDRGQWEPSHLRAMLTDAGVGSRVPIREVARKSGQRLNREWVRLLLQPIPAGQRGPRYDVEHLQSLAETLRRLDVHVTFRQIEQAVLADLGYPSAVSGYADTTSGDQLPVILDMVEQLSDADRRRLLVHLSGLLAPVAVARRA